MNSVIVIPARLQATRLPGKPLALIGGEPMIVQVWRRAMEADVGPVYVATDAQGIAEAVARVGGHVVMTREDHPSGSDRVFEAVSKVDPGESFDAVVNLQGDLPTLEPRLIRDCVTALQSGADIGTLAAEIEQPSDALDPNIVKVIGSPLVNALLRAHYFTRAAAPFGSGPLYHHIGLYAFKRASLARFVALPPSYLETRERLEQLRAIEDGMRIHVAVVDTVPLGVDTPADLEKANAVLSEAKSQPPINVETAS